jgi:Flp pilus assembly pilin Flp
MRSLCIDFLGQQEGQDLVEYTLLVAFVCLVASAFFLGSHKSIYTIWEVTNNNLSQATETIS